MSKEVVISAKNVKKDFYLPHDKGSNSLKGKVVDLFRKRDKEIDTQHALKGISFEIKKGEFFGIVGRNGSGKSTLLKMLAGIYQPTSGEIKTQGKLVPFIELGVGFNPELTGRENVYLNGALLGFSSKEIDFIYDEIVEFAELQDFMEQKLKNYSSGMQVRLAFSVATRAKADVLIVDEVLAVGDADFQRKCYRYFKSLKETDTTIVFVTHDMNAARNYCDRMILIEKGLIMEQGDPFDVSDGYLKLFNKAKDDTNKEPGRWGSGDIKFKSIEFDIKKEVITISTELDNPNGIKEAIIDFKFYAIEGVGRLRAGFNTMEDMTLVGNNNLLFEIDNVFGNEEFTVEAEILSPDQLDVYDKWKEIYNFRNRFAKENRNYPIKLSVRTTRPASPHARGSK